MTSPRILNRLETIEQIIPEIRTECIEQMNKFGVQNYKPSEWLMILGEEVGEANREALELHFNLGAVYSSPNEHRKKLEAYRGEMIQVAATALSALAALEKQLA